ncbi:mCG14532, isoform CRA_b, partial [Mus musculus]
SPKDATDRCCVTHDCCYKRLEKSGCGTKLLKYKYSHQGGQITCSGEDESEQWDNEGTRSSQDFLDIVHSSNGDLLLSKAARSTFVSLAAECLGHRSWGGGANEPCYLQEKVVRVGSSLAHTWVRIRKSMLPGLGNFYSTGSVLLLGSGTVSASVLIL